jgi:hypothetical protein
MKIRSFTIHPSLHVREIWPGPAGYPWEKCGTRCWTREGLLRRFGRDGLLAIWTTGGFTEPWEGNYTMIWRSEDNGETWADAGAFRNPRGGLFTTEIFSPRDGEFHAFINHYRSNAVWMTQNLSYRAISTDAGKTWSGPHSLPGGIQGVWPNRGIRHSSGRWIIPISWAELIGEEWAEPVADSTLTSGLVGTRSSNPMQLPPGTELAVWSQHGSDWADRNHLYACGVILSDDEGETMRLRGYLKGGLHGHLIEPRVVELSHGKIVMLIRSQRDGRLWRAFSEDGGETWTKTERSEIPNPAAKVCILKAKDNRIFLIHNPIDLDGLTYGGRNPLSLWISEDDMRTWPVKIELIRDSRSDANLNYPDGFIDEERGEILMCWEDAVRVYLTRIPLDIS